jgi:ParB/RepB/Spo0J family partition protein
MDLELRQLDLRYAALRLAVPERDAELSGSLLAEGQRTPVLVIGNAGDSSRFILIDGYARVRGLQRIGSDVVRVLVLDFGEPEALLWHHLLQSGPRRHALEDGWLISELVETHGWSQQRIAHELGRTVSWVSRRLALVATLPAIAQERIRSGHLCAQAAMKYLVPLARANRSHCEELLGKLGKERLSVRQYEALYAGYRRGDGTQRKHLVQEPLLYLRAKRVAELPTTVWVQSPQQQLIAVLDEVSQSCWRARKVVRQSASGLEVQSTRELVRAWTAACDAHRALQSTVTEQLPIICTPRLEEPHAGTGHATSHSPPGL